jgi:ribonuclease VapC
MVIDTSAILAIVLREPEAEVFVEAIANAAVRVISVASVFEASIVLQRRLDRSRVTQLDELITSFPIAIWPVSVDQITWARHALETYGRGRHPAKLNFGDCFTYALAKSTGEPILFKGSDFSLTDLKSAV